MAEVVGIKFRHSGKVYYFSPCKAAFKKGEGVIVETARGVEYGTVVCEPKEVADDKIVQPLKPVSRRATPEDEAKVKRNEAKEPGAMKIAEEKVRERGLKMKLIDAEYSFDGGKIVFYFTAAGRIDFRELVKDLASIFRTRIELRQIGVRDETKLIGGIGICGRPLCCHTFLSEFAPVSIKMAKEQNLSLNPSKISGVCGRLMCCLKNEQEAYEYLNERLPHINENVSTSDGYKGTVQSVSVLKQLVKVVITKENDEKEVREYHVDDLKFEKNVKRTSASPGLTLPDEELDENALKELEQMEKGDIEDLAEENEQNNPKAKRQQKKNFNKPKKNFEQKNNSRDTYPEKKGKHGNRENYHHTQKNFRRGNGNNNNGGYSNNYNNFKPE